MLLLFAWLESLRYILPCFFFEETAPAWHNLSNDREITANSDQYDASDVFKDIFTQMEAIYISGKAKYEHGYSQNCVLITLMWNSMAKRTPQWSI